MRSLDRDNVWAMNCLVVVDARSGRFIPAESPVEVKITYA